jgi:HSP20 family protein
MRSLTRWDPFREMMSIRNTMDRLFDSYMYNQGETPNAWSWELPLDVSESEDAFLVKASLPGINPDDLEITFNNNTLTIRGEVKSEEETEGTRYHMRERRYGSFTRSITLPRGIQGDAIEANYEAGVLALRLPKAEELKPKRIAVRSGETPMIEGKAKSVVSKN